MSTAATISSPSCSSTSSPVLLASSPSTPFKSARTPSHHHHSTTPDLLKKPTLQPLQRPQTSRSASCLCCHSASPQHNTDAGREPSLLQSSHPDVQIRATPQQSQPHLLPPTRTSDHHDEAENDSLANSIISFLALPQQEASNDQPSETDASTGPSFRPESTD
ncbi:hypothetical protein ACQY0O_006189 [Thecaphora frezii]